MKRERRPSADREAGKRRAREFWDALSPAERWDVGDQLISGSFDWRDWAERFGVTPPDLNALDEIRMFWEITR